MDIIDYKISDDRPKGDSIACVTSFSAELGMNEYIYILNKHGYSVIIRSLSNNHEFREFIIGVYNDDIDFFKRVVLDVENVIKEKNTILLQKEKHIGELENEIKIMSRIFLSGH